MRMSFLLGLMLCAQAAQASSRFEVIGLSRTHLALRELYARAECCGADPVVDCRYEGVSQLQKRLDVVKPGIGNGKMPSRPWGVRLHVLPWKAGVLVTPSDEGVEGHRVFEIYESVTRMEACTPKANSTARLAEAHAHAKSVGIDLKAPLVASTVDGDPTLAPQDCAAGKYAPLCRPDEVSGPPFFVFAAVPDRSSLDLFVQVAQGTWRQVTVASNGGVWFSPRREAENDVGRVVHFRLFAHFMGEVTEFPTFLVEPAR